MAGLAAQDIMVRVRLTGGSAFRAEAQGVAGSLDELGAASKRSNAAMNSGGMFSFLTRGTANLKSHSEQIRKIGSNMKQAGRDLSYLSIPIIGIGYYAIKSATQFSQAMNLLRVQANVTQKEMNRILPGMFGVSNLTGYNMTQLGQAMYHFESVGIRGPAAVAALAAAAKGSRIGQDDLDTVAHALAGILKTNPFDIGRGPNAAAHAMMLLERTAALGDMRLPELTTAIGTGILPQFTAFGLGYKDLAAILAGTSRLGINPGYEANRLKLTMTQFASATTGPARQALAQLGLSTEQLFNTLHQSGGFIKVLELLKGKLPSLPGYEQAQVLAELGGRSRGIANLATVLRALPQIQSIFGQLGTADVAAFNQRWKITQKTPAVQQALIMQRLNNAMIQLGQVLIPTVLPALVKLAGYVGDIATGFSKLPTPMKDLLVGLLGFGAAVGPLLWIFGNLVTVGGTIIGLLGVGGAAGDATVVGGLTAFRNGLASTILKLGFLGLAAYEIYQHLPKSWQNTLKSVVNNGIGAFVSNKNEAPGEQGSENVIQQLNQFLQNTKGIGLVEAFEQKPNLFPELAHDISFLRADGHLTAQNMQQLKDYFENPAHQQGLSQATKDQLAKAFPVKVHVLIDGKPVKTAVDRHRRNAENRR